MVYVWFVKIVVATFAYALLFVTFFLTALHSTLYLVGEIVEWIGFAIACDSLSAWAFAFYTFANLAPRAYKVTVLGGNHLLPLLL